MSTVLAVMDEAPSVTVQGITVLHNTAPWRVATNRHNSNWGWIEGAPGNIRWSDDEPFNRVAAGEMVAAHAKWLEDQKPISIKLVEARQRYVEAKAKHDEAHAVYMKANAVLVETEESLLALAALRDEP